MPYQQCEYEHTSCIIVRPRQRQSPQPKRDREAELHYITRHGVRLQVADLHITSITGQKQYVPEILPAFSTHIGEPVAVYRMSKFKLKLELWTQQFRCFRLNGMAIFFLSSFFQRLLAKAISPTSNGRNQTKFGMQLPYIIPLDWIYSKILSFSKLMALFESLSGTQIFYAYHC